MLGKRGRKTKVAPSKFWSKKVNPKGASIGNAIENFKNLGKGIKKIVTAKPVGRKKRM